jgi:hypothetical protein
VPGSADGTTRAPAQAPRARAPARSGAIAGALAALLAWCAAAEPAADPAAPAPAADPCAAVRAEPRQVLPDLQQLLERGCRWLRPAPEAPPGELPPRLRVALGGWADASYRDNDLDERGYSVALNHVNLHLDARLDERWQLFAEGEYEHEPELTGFRDEREFELEQLFAQYSHSDLANLRAGRFSTPFGYWTPIHWSILVDTIESPLHEEQRLIPEQIVGLRAFGRSFPGRLLGRDAELDYSLHAGYGDDAIHTDDAEGPNGGADLRLRLGEEHLLGASFYAQGNRDRYGSDDRNAVAYAAVGLPFELLLRGEYMHQWRDQPRPGYARHLDLLYVAARWTFWRSAYLHYRFGWGDDDRYGPTTRQRIHTGTLGVRPLGRLVLKLELSHHHFERRGPGDYLAWATSLGVLF